MGPPVERPTLTPNRMAFCCGSVARTDEPTDRYLFACCRTSSSVRQSVGLHPEATMTRPAPAPSARQRPLPPACRRRRRLPTVVKASKDTDATPVVQETPTPPPPRSPPLRHEPAPVATCRPAPRGACAAGTTAPFLSRRPRTAPPGTPTPSRRRHRSAGARARSRRRHHRHRRRRPGVRGRSPWSGSHRR